VFGFDALLDQHRPVRLLTSALETGSLPNAYLFTGPEGVGKKTAAQTLAMACNCQAGEGDGAHHAGDQTAEGGSGGSPAFSCGRCRSCRKILSETHPDVHWVLPAGNYIKVDQVRELCRRLSLKPYEAKTRLVVIAEAHTLNPEAGNTLLKILEAPPEKTLFILTARQGSDLLPTILSRCRHIRFNPISRENIKHYLEAHYAIDARDADIVAAMADGSLSNARVMVEKNWMAHRNWIIKTLTGLHEQPINYRLAFSEFLAKDSGRLLTSLDIMKSWVRDLAVYPYLPDQLINKDLIEEITARSEEMPTRRLLDINRQIETAARSIQANANARLAMDHLVIALSNKMACRDRLRPSNGENRTNGKSNRHPV